jgi:hypothetical protein
MASFQLFSKLETLFDATGQLLPGGQLRFYEVGTTTTPQDVYAESALTTNLGSTVDLDASGRPENEVWANTADAYFVELYDSNGDKQGEISRKEVPGGAGQSIPVPQVDEFLTGDGTNFDAENLANRLVPDPTGQANKVLSTDGSTLTWIAKPADGADATLPPLPDGGITVTTTTVLLGDQLLQKGTGTATSSGSHTTSASISFPTAYTSAPEVWIQPTGGGVTGDGYYVVPSRTSVSTSGFTVGFNVNEDGSESGKNISLSVAFSWFAWGTKT